MSAFETPDIGSKCPHFEQVDERELRRLFSKVAAIRSEDYELFEFTHRPMEVFKGTNAKNAPTWHEDRIYNELTRDRPGNFAVVIEGEVGTGKSELCAYITHQLRLDDRPILHIDKNDDLMSILSDRIPEFYEEQFGEELEGAGEFRNLRDDMETVPRTVADNATTGAILNLRREYDDVNPSSDQGEQLQEFVAEKLDTFVNRGEYDQRIEFVSPNEYRQREELQIFDDSVEVHRAVEKLNQELWSVIRDRYSTDSLDDVLEQVSARFEDERPVIVFEDFSIAAMEAEKLGNYIERDKGSDNWDFIVAGTRDATEVLRTRTGEDRFLFFQTNEQGSNSVLFLDESTSVDFVRPYLGYIKSHDGSVRYNRDTEDGTFELRQPKSGSLCAQCGFCDESFRDLYPFNQSFLRRIYAGLEESRQSPREFIITVFAVLEEYHDGFVDAPSSADVLRPIENRISVADIVYDEAEVYADLAKWYGTEDSENEQILVPRQFVDAFDFETTGLPDAISIESDLVRIKTTGDTSPSGTGGECPNCGGAERQNRSDGAVVCASCNTVISPPSTDPIQEKIDEAKGEIDAWLEDAEKFAQTDEYIRRGLRDLLEELTADYRLLEGQPLEYNLSSQKEPFVYPDGSEAPDNDQIILDRADFNRSDLRSLAEFGVYREEQPRSADYEEQFERIGTQLTRYAKEWRQTVMQHELESDEVLYKGYAGYDFTDFVLASYATLCLLDDPWQPVTAERLDEQYRSDDDLALDENLQTTLRQEVPADEYVHFEDALENADNVESLVGELLGVSSSVLDVPRIRQRLDDNPPYEVLSDLGRGYIDNINYRLRFETHQTVKSFADTMYDVRKTLDEVSDHGYEQETVGYVSDVIASTNLERVSELYNRLQTYDQVDPDLLEALGKVCSHDQNTLDEVVAAAELASERRTGGPWQQIHAALTSQKLQNTAIVEQFQSVPLQGGGGSETDGFGTAFLEVSEHYVD